MWEKDRRKMQSIGLCTVNIGGLKEFRRVVVVEEWNPFLPPYWFYQARPEANVIHHQLGAPLSNCRVIASNQGLQQTNPDRSSHLGFTLGQLWCHPKGAMERGKPAVSNVCRVSARPG